MIVVTTLKLVVARAVWVVVPSVPLAALRGGVAGRLAIRVGFIGVTVTALQRA